MWVLKLAVRVIVSKILISRLDDECMSSSSFPQAVVPVHLLTLFSAECRVIMEFAHAPLSEHPHHQRNHPTQD